MNTNYRKTFLGLREILRKHDPLRLLQKFGGDRFDSEIYGYEATTILEKLGFKPAVEEIEGFLTQYSISQKYEQDQEKSKNAAKEIHALLSKDF